jgi:DNA (cytosine-5)-methyltransferase 1
MAEDEPGWSESGRPHLKDRDFTFPHLELPTDPDQLRSLPTGFLEMTEMEQQEELWIARAEEQLGREWLLPDTGKHRRYGKDFTPYSPSKVLGMLHRWRHRAWTPDQWQLARAIAGNKSLRLPVLAAQAFLRRHTLLARRRDVDLKMERYLGATEDWKGRLAQLENETGISEADIKQWLWILSPVSGDIKLQRFFQSKCRKPLFLLQILLAKDKKIQEPATFLALVRYIKENYILAERPQDELDHPAYKSQGPAMTWHHYMGFLYRLVWHCREGWPAAMPLLARLTADFLVTIRLDSGARAMTGPQARALVLNKSLQYFSWPARVRPIDHMEHNWAAQRHMLRLAASTEPPLVMDQNGYRAVRAVLIALQKTKGEAKNADRAAKTWPPYRRTLDGIDERRDPEDDLSRSAKAGMLVRAAGYNDDIVDRALSALGGSMFGQSPTIQTRSLPPPFFSGSRSSHNIYLEWAAQLKATRNAREAWVVFENPPQPNLRPDLAVYGEMFEKLYARPITESPAIRPGDAKEVFPIHDGNLSEFEIARLTPPSPEELYDMMLQDKLKPTRKCLVVLVKNAPSKMAALRYLNDSPYYASVGALKVPVSKADKKSLVELSKLPLSVFNAWITMLCRLHTRAPREETVVDDPAEKTDGAKVVAAGSNSNVAHQDMPREVSQAGSIQEAISLTTAFHRHNTKAASNDRHPWHTIMEALAGRKVLYSRMGAEYNLLETLMTFLKVFERTTTSQGVDPRSFEALCVMIRKALKLTTFEQAEEGKMVPRAHIAGTALLDKLLFKAHRYAVKTFAAITAPVPTEIGGVEPEGGAGDAGDGVTPGMLRFNVVGRPVYRYMLALACCGDHAEMVRVMDWLLDGWDQEYIREEAKTAHNLDYHYTMRTIAYFAEMGKKLVEPAEMDRLRERLHDMRWDTGCTWFWPKEGWQEERMLPELETDLVMVDLWPQLRQMVNSVNPDLASVESLSDLRSELPLEFAEQEQEQELVEKKAFG